MALNPVCSQCTQARKWVAQRAAGLQQLTLRPRHASSAGAIAPLWPRLAGSLRALDLSLERELPEYKPQVRYQPCVTCFSSQFPYVCIPQQSLPML
jgi:hypothetical protein